LTHLTAGGESGQSGELVLLSGGVGGELGEGGQHGRRLARPHHDIAGKELRSVH